MKGSRIRNYNANVRLAADRGRDGKPSGRSAKKTGKPKTKAGKDTSHTRFRRR
jgi:hypothetical protein